MAYSYNILLGRITKVSGFEGALAVKLERSFIDNLPQMESVFLEIEGRPVPFFISESEYSGNDNLKISFIGYDTTEKVSEFKGCKVYLTSVGEEIVKSEDFSELTGYVVQSDDNVLIGYIKEIIQNPGQWLLNIISPGNKEILMPFHKDFIISVDDDKRVLVMKLPEGLTEIN